MKNERSVSNPQEKVRYGTFPESPQPLRDGAPVYGIPVSDGEPPPGTNYERHPQSGPPGIRILKDA